MKIYLVGGAVRDKLLGRPVHEKDYVVVGATVNDMLRRGFRQVGKDFPVFIHPKTAEEYALARKERKIGKGYTGFTFDVSAEVTLEEDLKRRDLTINAMAILKTQENEEPSAANLIDPYGGKADLQAQLLRHVSPAFAEDPVRILRVARFAARFNFSVAEETQQLMRFMVESGEVQSLVSERVWKEFERALTESYPTNFFSVIKNCGALAYLFPMIDPPACFVLAAVSTQTTDNAIRFAALFSGVPTKDVVLFCDQYKVPNDYRELGYLVNHYFKTYQEATSLSATQLLLFFQSVDSFRREKRFKHFLKASELIASSRHEGENTRFLEHMWDAAKKEAEKLIMTGLKGREIAEKIKALRLKGIQQALDVRERSEGKPGST